MNLNLVSFWAVSTCESFTCSIAYALLELKQLGEIVLQRCLSGVDVDVHVTGRLLRHRVDLMVSSSRNLHTITPSNQLLALGTIKLYGNIVNLYLETNIMYIYLLIRLEGVVLLLLHNLHIHFPL